MISYVWWSKQECHIIELLLLIFNVKNLYLWLLNVVCYEFFFFFANFCLLNCKC